MKSSIRITCFLIACCITSSAYPNKHLLKLALAVSASPTKSHRTYAREILMQEFKNISYANTQTLAAIVTAYHYKNETHLYAEHSGTLYEAIDNFSGTSGFPHKIYQLLNSAENPSFVKGHMYELETALALKERRETVTHFDYEFFCPTRECKCSIDLVTKNHLIECKNIAWDAYKLNNRNQSNKLQAQLLSYRSLVDDEENEENLSFTLISKQPITQEWKEWLDENDIEYAEGH